MVVFCGKLSEKSKNFMLKENALVGLVSSLVVFVIFAVIITILAVMYELWLAFVFIALGFFVVIITTCAPYIQKHKTLENVIPSKIVINDDTIQVFLKSVVIEKAIDTVKSVVEYDEWFYIKFKFPKIEGVLCQKNLIKQGAFEEFKKIFDGKLIKKI